MNTIRLIKELKISGSILCLYLAAVSMYIGAVCSEGETTQIKTFAFTAILIWVCASTMICLRIRSYSKDDSYCWTKEELKLLYRWYRNSMILCLSFSAAGIGLLYLLLTDLSDRPFLFFCLPCYLMGISAGAAAGSLHHLYLKESPSHTEGKKTL